MKLSYARATLALAMAASLAACGGKASFEVGGTVDPSHPLTNPHLILANGSDSAEIPVNAVTFTLPKRISYGTAYAITVLKDPDNMHCAISNGTGTAGQTVAIAAVLSCIQNSNELSGQVAGLVQTVGQDPNKIPTLTLNYGSYALPPISASAVGTTTRTNFSFGQVAVGQVYSITVLTQPEGKFCTVENGTGTMSSTPISNVLVTCVPK